MKKTLIISIFSLCVLINGACSSKGSGMDAIKGKEGVFAIIGTARGNIAVELYYKDTPLTVKNFVGLAEGTLDAAKGKPFYDGLKFHRVISKANGDSQDFMIQGGDPLGNGTGGPGYAFADEIVEKFKFDGKGVLAMANSGANTNGSQFFITHVETPWLNGKHTIFGRVVDDASQKVVDAVLVGDKINSVKIVRQGSEAKAFTATQQEFDELAKLALEEVRKKKEAAMADKIAAVEKAFPNYEKTAEGIYFKITKAGSGAKMGKGKKVAVDYKGYFVNGEVFDTSKGRTPLEFETAAGQMIPGFDMMVQDMQPGESRTVVLPPDLAYGDAGAGSFPAAHTLRSTLIC